MTNKWAAAFGLLAVLLVFGAAGSLALDSSYDQTTETRNASAEFDDQSPPVVETGRDVSGTLATLLPLFGYVAVPLGILGVLSLGGIAYINRQSSGGIGR
jgi:hypothetical protein